MTYIAEDRVRGALESALAQAQCASDSVAHELIQAIGITLGIELEDQCPATERSCAPIGCSDSRESLEALCDSAALSLRRAGAKLSWLRTLGHDAVILDIATQERDQAREWLARCHAMLLVHVTESG